MKIMMEGLFKEYEGAFGEERPQKKEKTEFKFAYSPFALQDAVGERNIKKIWIEYMKLRIRGLEAEKLAYNFISKARDMLAIKKGAGKDDLNIKSDYPYNKSKRDAKNWKEDDLKNFYTKLVCAYHRSRMFSGEDLDIALERIILSI